MVELLMLAVVPVEELLQQVFYSKNPKKCGEAWKKLAWIGRLLVDKHARNKESIITYVQVA